MDTMSSVLSDMRQSPLSLRSVVAFTRATLLADSFSLSLLLSPPVCLIVLTVCAPACISPCHHDLYRSLSGDLCVVTL